MADGAAYPERSKALKRLVVRAKRRGVLSPFVREHLLKKIRNRKMARSAHAFVRGSTASFYECLRQLGGIPTGPAVWICGDCHVGNLGPMSDRKGNVAVEIRDLDQTVIGNPAHDLIRLGLSLCSAARGTNSPGAAMTAMLHKLLVGYCDGLRAGDRPYVASKPKLIENLLKQSMRRRWRELAVERLDDAEPTIPFGKRFLTPLPEEQAELRLLFRRPTVQRLFEHGRNVKPVDFAYWVKGCSSLGRLRFAVVVRSKKGEKTSYSLVDIKEAVASVADAAPRSTMPTDPAKRVVAGARALAPSLGERMVAERLCGKAVVVRELLPADLKIDGDRLSSKQMAALARYLGGIVGHAHGRQLSPRARQAWITKITSGPWARGRLPMWLWRAVVELVAHQEKAYLEHCRVWPPLEEEAVEEERSASNLPIALG